MPALLAPQPSEQTLKRRPWGGRRLTRIIGSDRPEAACSNFEPIGESWDFSTLPCTESTAHGRPLSEQLAAPLPFLAKRIDTATASSIQVHPADDGDGRPGKEEAWIVLEAEPHAHVFAGLRAGICEGDLRGALRAADHAQTALSGVEACLERVSVEPGSIVLIPAGTIHAISGGLLLAEIQQPVDRTFRFFDYGRNRPLQREAAFAALRVEARPQYWHPQFHRPDVSAMASEFRPHHDAQSALRGDHFELQPLLAGHHEIEPSALPRLLVHALGCTVIRQEHADPVVVTAGQLRLATGPALQLDVSEHGLVVLARMKSSDARNSRG